MYVGWLRVQVCYGICGADRGQLVRVISLLLYSSLENLEIKLLSSGLLKVSFPAEPSC